ncbi:MAG: nucleotidyl transferase AbiEii/AbiGii toxin family protein [Spirochaetes bacterium]|nr:nucleotidyl transferase AbiEii/AbiGii toxin family protein [Spirochaetota bacterium]
MNEQALKDRIKNIANTENSTFGEVLKRLELERFLVRLSRSKYNGIYIFKGGLLLSWYLDIGRETKDIDFLASKISADAATIEQDMKNICAVDIDDGFVFTFGDIVPLEQPHMNYPGFRVILDLIIGNNMRDRIQIDIGIGDSVSPETESFPLTRYKDSFLFEGSVSLQVYPVESIFAEKLETLISKGAANSRMKDYHDLYLLSHTEDLIDSKKLIESINKTFKTRDTSLILPIQFNEEEISFLQRLWSAHCRGLGSITTELKLPLDIIAVITELNNWLKSHHIG